MGRRYWNIRPSRLASRAVPFGCERFRGRSRDLRRADRRLGRADKAALADGSALLWRLQLQDIEVSERWRLLADHWAMNNLEDARPFYVVHAMMAFVAAGRYGAAMRLAEALPSTHGNEASSLPPRRRARGAVVRRPARLRPQRVCRMRGMA